MVNQRQINFNSYERHMQKKQVIFIKINKLIYHFWVNRD